MTVNPKPVILTGITVDWPSKTYYEEDTLSKSEITVKAQYSDGSNPELTSTEYELTITSNGQTTTVADSYTFLKGGNYDLTVTYDGMTSNPVKIHVTDQNGYHEEENGTYVVTGTDGLQTLFNKLGNDALSATIILTTDQTVTGTFGNFENPFTGTLQSEDPNEKVTITLPNGSLFDQIGENSNSNGIVQNIIINVSGEINGKLYNDDCYAGVVAGINYGTITGCEVSSSNNSQIYQRGLENVFYMYMGGIAGKNSGRISNCTSSIGMTANYKITYLDFSEYFFYLGGIVGYNTSGGSVSDCDFTSSCTILLDPLKKPQYYSGLLIGYDENSSGPVD